MASTGEVWKLGHRPALDGMRGIAILLVLACHLQVPPFTYYSGSVGVTVFFTLSGFLITALLLEEAGRGGVSLSRFYRRRALRLLPALTACAVIVLAVGAVVGHGFGTLRQAALALFYVGNWAKVEQVPMGGLAHTWSLSIEEQFYLVWPLVLIVAARHGRRAVGLVAVVGALASLAARVALMDGPWERVYYGTDTNGFALLVGAAAAAFLVRERDGRLSSLMAAAAVVGLLGWSLVTPALLGGLVAAVTVPLLTAGIILAVVQGRSVPALAWGPLVWLGRRSYGLYLWHWPVVVLALEVGPFTLTSRLVVLTVALALTVLSWRYVETPFLRMKDRSVSRVEAAQREPDQGVVLPRERLDLGGDLRVRR